MGCRCSERRTAIVQATKAIARGDARAAAAQAGFVGRTAAEDARAALATRIATARSRLGR
ncbi:hypothetical protein [Methylobacterium organophilum]|uniref:Uncharacterized protein n=1 Tax=Methylobacterium organophilum TaxID=410 RepID=A0ABQ4T8I2_METOR|nr:hypothetical protein [Methylobacterium organophilum]GJE27961.1 hypothetical protein LKMONMHP_2823 [Methylobacterium organophilum]